MSEEISIHLVGLSTDERQKRYYQLYRFLLDTEELQDVRLKESQTSEGEMSGGIIEAIVASFIAAVIVEGSKFAIQQLLKNIHLWKNAQNVQDVRIIIRKKETEIEISGAEKLEDQTLIEQLADSLTNET